MGNCYLETNELELARKYLEKGKELAEMKNDKKWINEANKLLQNNISIKIVQS
jgi:hypothetical protein